MKFFITSITVLVLYAASSVVAAPLPAPAIAAYDGNMMKRDLSGVVDLERRRNSQHRHCKRNGSCPYGHPKSYHHPNPDPSSNPDPNSLVPTNSLAGSSSSAGDLNGALVGDSPTPVEGQPVSAAV
ncbi:hypothetical protein FRC14_000592 [Serendipita sp. 396]|nr:hypothetical protein FRC14_000592 [Serendipita sp. 396]KAG8785908.1 hypothetical protein FRC15_000462 [Serendipita sp. 397]KAG8801003.1 hypothetical protein FRC16_001497 [Serendipita sp. 398]KAG8816062.1 hypothetical protein FRC19_000598 [Serendipita sp. 401]KAG8842992.1 hypothetical protein FRB91_003665 [Serendipita sp. 411]KAG8869594.1 hypothetical protein FRC20_001178 [Serendipita sp. 405]KAG9051961.1 hypothetical protein FS842_010759 [Serendipita sp. 407]